MMTLTVNAVTLILLGSGVFCWIQDGVREACDSNAVYSVAIANAASVPIPRFLIAIDTIPYSATEQRFPVDPDNIITSEQFSAALHNASSKDEGRQVLRHRPCILIPEAERLNYVSAMRDYREKNQVSTRLAGSLNLPRPYRFLEERTQDCSSMGCSYSDQNDTQSFVQVSAVGFSSDKALAIVYVGWNCPWCGSWRLHVLKKIAGKWRELPVACGFRS